MDMDNIVAEYEKGLRTAEEGIENALAAVCDVRGDAIPRRDLLKALEAVREGIRSSWKLL